MGVCHRARLLKCSWQVLAANVAMNAPNCIDACHVFEYSWGRYSLCRLYILPIDMYGDSGHAASCDGSCTAPYDVIIASDVVYSTNGARLLAQSIPANLRPGGVFLMVLAGCGFLSRSDKFLCLAPQHHANKPHLIQAHTKRLAIFFGNDGQLQRESTDSGLDEFTSLLGLCTGP